MVALQLATIAFSSLAIALVFNFPDWHHRPPFESIKIFFWSISLLVSFLIIFIAGQSIIKSGTFQWSKVAWAFMFLFAWWYLVGFLLLNTYGS